MPKSAESIRTPRAPGTSLSITTPGDNGTLLRRVPWTVWVIAGGVALIVLPPALRRSLLAGGATIAFASLQQRLLKPFMGRVTREG